VYEKPTNYVACQTFHGFFAFISEPFAKFLFIIMNALHSLTHSWGLSIILTTVVLRILMYPLNQWSMRSMRSMQEISPLIKAIQEKYKKEPSKAQAELMALYREKKVNPFSGCLPLIIQMPFLIGMFDLLKTTFELRGAPFIPGWITDLSAPDVVLDWHFSFFLIGSQLHLLPILLGATMWWQQSLSGNLPKDQKQWTDQQRQQRAVGNIMTVVMTVLFYQFPSGLNIYWISSMLLGILQQWWTNRKMTKASLPVPR
jgi:YidC/Oxa1 family membrane protein insertase